VKLEIGLQISYSKGIRYNSPCNGDCLIDFDNSQAEVFVPDNMKQSGGNSQMSTGIDKIVSIGE